jgi:KEOPS complex subunit Pcc1
MIVLAEFELDLGQEAKNIYGALFPELSEDYRRTRTTLRLEGNLLILNVEATDIVSMRAALNGWFRLIKISHELCSAVSIV